MARVLLAAALAWCAMAVPNHEVVAAYPESPAETIGCTPVTGASAAETEGLVPTQSLAQGNVSDHGPPRSILVVATRPDPIVPVIDPASAPTVAGVDLTTHALVALFIGRWPQEGHHVTIESIRATDAGVCLTALVTGPAPGQDAADAETYPYHVVAVPLDALPQTPGTTWTAVSPDGVTIASARFP